MNLNTFLLCTLFPVLLMSTCESCPPPGGINIVFIEGVDIDLVYDEIEVLPTGITEPVPRFFIERRSLCGQCLPLDISHDTTTYILRGSTRTDTITFQYTTNLYLMSTKCGFQVETDSLQVTSTFTSERIIAPDLSNIRWNVQVEL